MTRGGYCLAGAGLRWIPMYQGESNVGEIGERKVLDISFLGVGWAWLGNGRQWGGKGGQIEGRTVFLMWNKPKLVVL